MIQRANTLHCTANKGKKMKYLYKYGLYITIIDLSPAIGRQRFDSFLLHQPFLITITSTNTALSPSSCYLLNCLAAPICSLGFN